MNTKLRYPATWNLSENDRSILELFRRRCVQLRQYGLRGYPAETAITWDSETLHTEAELPNERDLRSATMAVRHFILDKEATYFYKISNMLYRAAQEDRFLKALVQMREEFKKLMNDGLSGSFHVAGEEIATVERLLHVFINGEYFHSDMQYQEFLNKIDMGLGPLFKQRFAQAIYKLSGCIQNLDLIASNALGVNLLAQNDAAKKVQETLQRIGVNDCFPIDVFEYQDAVRCHIHDLCLNQAQVLNSPVCKLFKPLMEVYPGRKKYGIDIMNENGAPILLEAEIGESGPLVISLYDYDPTTLMQTSK